MRRGIQLLFNAVHHRIVWKITTNVMRPETSYRLKPA